MRYATPTTWAEYFRKEEKISIGINTIRRRLEKAGITAQVARGGTGRKYPYFSEADVRKVCADIFTPVPKADKTGFFEMNGEKYATVEAWTKVLPISKSPIIDHLKKAGINGMEGKTSQGRLTIFYSESDVLEVCRELIDESLPQADDTGFIHMNGEKYETVTIWARTLGIDDKAIKRRKDVLTGIKGRAKGGVIRIFYPESSVRKCLNVTEKKNLPQANKYNFIVLNGIEHRTVGSWAQELKLDTKSIRRRLKKHRIKSIKGITYNGAIRDFYSDADIRIICDDLTGNLPQADEKGFFEKDGVKYGTSESWSRVLPICGPAISERLKRANIESIAGKIMSGNRLEFYSEEDVQCACADLLENLPQTDESGFFEKDGEKFGGSNAWSKVLPFTERTINSRLQKIGAQSISGKSNNGLKVKLYSESDVLCACADLLEKRNPHAA
jgi:hypothetical protein